MAQVQVQGGGHPFEAGEMVLGIAHDFNNALTVIQGFLTVLRGQHRDPDTVRALDAMGKAATDAEHLMRRLRDVATGKASERRMMPLDLAELTRHTLDLLAPTVAQRSGDRVRVHQDLSDTVFVRGDGCALREALTNLVLNAVDAMPEGGTLGVAVRAMDCWAVMEVCDTGVGMDERTLSRIFEPYFTTKGDRGTGLGLTVTRRNVAQHGGTIQVSSAPGRGTRFVLSFPLTPPLEVEALARSYCMPEVPA